MTKLELKNIVKNFITEIDEELSVTFKKGGYYFENATNCVNVDFTDFDDCGFLRHLKEFHKCKWADEFDLHLWSILHEIGHYETEDEICEEDGEEEIRFWFSLSDETMANDITIQNSYFNLTSEWYATEWAKYWIEHNKEKAKEMNNIIKGAR